MHIKTCVNFQKDRPKTVRGVALTRYLIHMHFNSVRGKKKSLVKNTKISDKNNFRLIKKPHAHLQSYIKTLVKFQKDQPETV